MRTLEEAQIALLSISDDQWLKLVEMLTYGVLELNSRTLTKVEIMFNVGHYPAMHFRLTTVLNDASDQNSSKQVSGFRFGFDQDIDDEVYIEPLSADGFWEDYLKENGITHVFASNEVGIKKLYRFIADELRLWEEREYEEIEMPAEDTWRPIFSISSLPDQ